MDDNHHHNGVQRSQEELDSFLTGVESKLRGPFSSLDLTKAITTTALRGSLSPVEYLQMIGQVLSRTEKVIQLRVLVALLGLDAVAPTSSNNNSNNNNSNSADDNDMDEQIYQLLTQAQESPAYEEWVRTVAGLVRGIMFTEATNEDTQQQHDLDHRETDVSDDHDGKATSTTCRGEEAQSVLDKTCQDFLKSVCELEQSTRLRVNEDDNSSNNSLWIADREPLFAPYRYALVSPELLDKVIPECNGTSHSYFQVNRDAAILSKDLEIEQQKAQEESKDLMARSAAAKTNAADANNNSNGSKGAAAPNDSFAYPGFRTPGGGGAAAKPKAPPTKTSMFLPTKRPGAGGPGGGGGGMARAAVTNKNAIHLRKAGAAQAHVANSRRQGMMSATSGAANGATNTAASSSTGGGGLVSNNITARSRAINQSQNRSKMKVIDVKEVEGLTKEQQERDKVDTKEQKLSARKRKIMEAAAQKGLVSTAAAAGKKSKTIPASSTKPTTSQAEEPKESLPEVTPAPTVVAAATTGGDLAQAVLLAYQQQVSDGQSTNVAAVTPVAKVAASTSINQPTITTATSNNIPPDLKALLDKANKLAPEDRLRVEQFFKERFNPTPDVMVYRMKLHENRATDPENGQAIKETFYLELDYDTFETKQLRKVKRK